jgi:cytochrome P450
MANVPSHVTADRVIDFDIANDPALKHDVFKRMEAVRDASPSVAWTTANGGHWLVFGQEELQRVLNETETFSSSHLAGGGEGPGFIPLSIDPPAHAPWRILLLKHFGPPQVRQLEPFVREWAEHLISKLDGATHCDFVRSVAEPMPLSVFMVMMGLPLERFDEFRHLVLMALTPPEPGEDMAERLGVHGKIMAILAELIEERRLEPRDDFVSRLHAEQMDGRPLTQPELMSICFLLFLAGLDTVVNAMTYGMRHIAADPELQEKLRRDHTLIPDTVERLLRRYTFVNTNRLVVRDTELGGATIKAGELVWCVLWGGSNDANAESEGPRHMAFGGGHHICLGMYLARLELRVMYETWFDHIGRFSLAPDDKPAMRGGTVMNITRLLLDLEPARVMA